MSEYAVWTEGLRKCFGRTVGVDGIDLRVPRGSIFGFLGPNGAGKTTTIRLLLGLLRPDAGRFAVLGREGPPSPEVLARVGYVPEIPALYPGLTAGELVSLCRRLYRRWDQALVDRYLDLFRLPRNRKVSGFSRGMKGQLALVLALAPRPDLLVLDEPTAGLDPLARKHFLQAVLAEATATGQTVFLSSHLLEDVERVADTLAMIRDGRLVLHRSMDEVKTGEKKVRVVFQGQAPPWLDQVPGVRRVGREGAAFLITVAGDVPSVLERLRTVPLFALEVIDLSLEQVFEEYATAPEE
ncbi:MAG: ABC transporter ATP-binding protein [Bacillota bacterium]|nr:ABC transporter ATP-binding protein [Bacillota bacterium]